MQGTSIFRTWRFIVVCTGRHFMQTRSVIEETRALCLGSSSVQSAHILQGGERFIASRIWMHLHTHRRGGCWIYGLFGDAGASRSFGNWWVKVWPLFARGRTNGGGIRRMEIWNCLSSNGMWKIVNSSLSSCCGININHLLNGDVHRVSPENFAQRVTPISITAHAYALPVCYYATNIITGCQTK